MTDDEKLACLDSEEQRAWAALTDDSVLYIARMEALKVIERCQRIRKAIPKDRVRYAGDAPSPHRAGV